MKHLVLVIALAAFSTSAFAKGSYQDQNELRLIPAVSGARSIRETRAGADARSGARIRLVGGWYDGSRPAMLPGAGASELKMNDPHVEALIYQGGVQGVSGPQQTVAVAIRKILTITAHLVPRPSGGSAPSRGPHHDDRQRQNRPKILGGPGN